MKHFLITIVACQFLFSPYVSRSESPTAQGLVDQLDSRRGMIVVMDDLALAVAMAQQSECTVFCQLADRDRLEAARETADAAGLLGTRMYLEAGDVRKICLADNLADLVVDPAGVTPDAELLRVLRPSGKFVAHGDVVRKPFAARTDVWSHPYHGPDNNPQSRDETIKRPFMTHFAAEPWYAAMPQQSVIAGGRIFKAYGHRTSALPQVALLHKLVAFNAFNGVQLWMRDLTPGFEIHRNTLIATADILYAADDVSCKRIDAATGKVLDEIVAPAELTDGPVWKWMALEDGILYALIGEKEPPVEEVRGTRFRGAGWPWWKIPEYSMQFGRTFLAIDPNTQRILWHYRQEEPIDGRSVCMANQRIFFTAPGKFVAALDQENGTELWKNDDAELLSAIGQDTPAQDAYYGFLTTSYAKCNDKMLYFAGPMRKNFVAVSAETGKLAWQKEDGNVQLVLRDEAVYALGGGRRNDKETSMKLDPVSGEVLARFTSRDRCTRATACVDTIFTRGGKGGSTATFDVTTSSPVMGVVSPMRPACQDGVLMAHGHLYWGPWICRCDQTQIGMISLAPSGSFDFKTPATNETRREMMSDALKVPPFELTSADWPTYRRDNSRSSRTELSVPTSVKKLWEFQPRVAAVATAPVTAGQIVFTGSTNGTVRAVDATTGKQVWRAYTGGAILYPPAVDRGRVYVGSADGWVYCFAVTDGKQIWRFRGGPTERNIPVFGRLQSTWPIGSGVLVDGGVAYAAAGMFNYDGTYLYALDAESGSIRWQTNDATGPTGPGVQGHLLLHDNLLCMAGGSTAPVAVFDKTTGNYLSKVGTAAGKDLFLVGESIGSSGHPLYWRQEDWHIIVSVELPVTQGSLLVTTEQVAVVKSSSQPDAKVESLWKVSPFHENNAVAIAQNVILVAGVNRTPEGTTTAGLVAVDPASGETKWSQPLPADPVEFGIAVNRFGNILVSLQDGRLVCYSH